MRGRKVGFITIAVALLFGAFYAYSFALWVKGLYAAYGAAAWHWWVIGLPAALLVALAVFFATWIGWVMLTASESKRKRLLNSVRPAPQVSSVCTGEQGCSRP